MIKLDSAVKKETIYVTVWVIILSALMESVFLILKAWDYKVLIGNALSAVATILNFLLLGVTVQKCLDKTPEDAKKAIKASQALRMVFLVIVAVIGATVPCFNIWATVIPLLFPRVAFVFHAIFNKPKGGANGEEK